MSHGIAGRRIVVREHIPWHGIANVVYQPDEFVTTEQAAEDGGLTFELTKVPNVAQYKGVVREVGGYSIWRDAFDDENEPQIIARNVSEKYTVFNGVEIAQSLSPLARIWPVESAGVIDNGAGMWMAMKAGSAIMGQKDGLDFYWFIYARHDGTGSVNCALTTVRPVCQNTIRLGLEKARTQITLRHTGNVQANMALVNSIIAQMQNVQLDITQKLQALALKSVTEEQVNAILEAAFPLPAEPKNAEFVRNAQSKGINVGKLADGLDRWEDDCNQMLKLREMSKEQYEAVNSAFMDISGTFWSVINGVSFVENHRIGKNNDRNIEVLTGRRSDHMNQAVDKALVLAGVV